MIALKILAYGGMGLLCYMSAMAHSVKTYGDILAWVALLSSTLLWLSQIKRIIKQGGE